MAMSGIEQTRRSLEQMGLPVGDLHDSPSSPQRFPDGGQFFSGNRRVSCICGSYRPGQGRVQLLNRVTDKI